MDEQNKNLILATVLSLGVILVWFIFFPPEPPYPETAAEQTTTNPSATGDIAAAPAVNDGATAVPGVIATPAETREVALSQSDRVTIMTDRLTGSLSLIGGRIDDLSLLDYNVRLNDASEKVTLLSPTGGPDAYYAFHGWVPTAASGYDFGDVPGASTPWVLVEGTTLTQTSPVTLEWQNSKGLTFHRKISVDDDYMFSITQSVTNNTDTEIRMFPYGVIARHGEPDVIGFYILHEGVVRSTDGVLEETKYKAVKKLEVLPAERANAEVVAVEESGWIGFTDKYWMTTLIPQAGQKFSAVTKFQPANTIYQTDMRLPVMAVAAGGTTEITTSLFAGAKEFYTIEAYQEQHNIDQFVDSIDWGWFYFLTKPIFRILAWLNGIIGNMGWAIIGLTLLIKALLFPLAYKSYVSMARMKELQPEMARLKEEAGDDKQKMQQGMMKLYKEKKVNPAAGCLPILLQIPIFFSLYKVIFVTIELRHAPFFGWIKDLSAPDPSSFLNLFGLLPFTPPDPSSLFAIFSIGVFPILMGITMWMQQKLNPAPTDKTQAQIFAWMPWVFMFMLGSFASGLVIYWVANNTITFIQQYTIMRSQGVKPDVFGNILSGFKRDKPAE